MEELERFLGSLKDRVASQPSTGGCQITVTITHSCFGGTQYNGMGPSRRTSPPPCNGSGHSRPANDDQY